MCTWQQQSHRLTALIPYDCLLILQKKIMLVCLWVSQSKTDKNLFSLFSIPGFRFVTPSILAIAPSVVGSLISVREREPFSFLFSVGCFGYQRFLQLLSIYAYTCTFGNLDSVQYSHSASRLKPNIHKSRGERFFTEYPSIPSIIMTTPLFFFPRFVGN